MVRRSFVVLIGVSALGVAFAHAGAQEAPTLETDRESARVESSRAASLEQERTAIDREVALARARRLAPFDLSWGLEP